MKYIDSIDSDLFSVHDMDAIMELLDCVEPGKSIYYHFKQPTWDLDFGLYALGCDEDINHLSSYVYEHKVGSFPDDRDKAVEGDEELEVIDIEELVSASSSDKGEASKKRKKIRDLQRAHKNEAAVVKDPFYIHQNFNTTKEVKQQIYLHSIQSRRELDFVKNDKNRIRVVCKGTIPNLGILETGGTNKSNDKVGPSQKKKKVKDGSIHKCTWVLLVNKWKKDNNWTVKTYEKQHTCLQTRKIRACNYKFLSEQIVETMESNPEIPLRALCEMLEKKYHVGLSDMKVHRAKTKALESIKGDFAAQYSCLKDYLQEGLLHALEKLFPTAEHKYCLRHLHENMKRKWRGKEFKDGLWNYGTCTTIPQFNSVMEELKKLNSEAYDCLNSIPPKHWSRSHFSATKTLQKIKERTVKCRAVFCGNGKYQVTSEDIWDMRLNNENVGIPETWVHPTYFLKTWKEMYVFKVEPINGRFLWEKSTCPTKLIPPKYRVPIGKPKKVKKICNRR
ncbi:unnamed protein product [Lactuca saligna]|uniref:Transposase MuDR plant domain-containing protein n=1 Tax=Lactuca saligna TaxID=75948 RepID=A0AA36EBA4_LACSI|nr:unnamed protein product [Lactuca saligna]